MIAIPCNLCGHNEQSQKLWTVPDRRWTDEARFELVRCKGCSLVYLNPAPEPTELKRHYPPSYYTQPPTPPPPAFFWRLRQIARYTAPEKSLDVGCGNGGFVHFFLQHGWDAYGLDNSPSAYALAKKLLGDAVALTTLHEASYPSDVFDVVCLFEVLEHVPNPLGHLEEIHRILKPGGFVFLSVPNFASWERVLFGRWWNGLDVPRHLHQFTPRTLERFLHKANFHLVELRSVSACCIQIDKSRITYCQESLRLFLQDLRLYPRHHTSLDLEPTQDPGLKRKAWWKRILNGFEHVLFEPFCLFNSAANHDNTIWACGQKRKGE